MSRHQRRRLLALWAPLAGAGVAMILASYTLTATLNGLTVGGYVVGCVGVLGACWDEAQTRAGRLP